MTEPIPQDPASAAPVPDAIFLDTSVFDGQQYNFQSAAFASFVEACQRLKIKTLMPDPVEREIRRHLTTRARSVPDALDQIRRDHPYLTKWQHFPKPRSRLAVGDVEVEHLALDALSEFLGKLECVRLDYEGVSIAAVMDWYDQQTPPFRVGRKQKEFPDALTIAILEHYISVHAEKIAVVSHDPDFKSACERYSELSYYSNLPRLTQHLVSEDFDVPAIRRLIEENDCALEQAIKAALFEFSFGHESYRHKVEEAVIQNVWMGDFNVVAVGEDDCTITFDGEAEVEALLRWEELDYAEYESYPSQDYYCENFPFSGNAKIALAGKRSSFNGVQVVQMDGNHVDLSESP